MVTGNSGTIMAAESFESIRCNPIILDKIISYLPPQDLKNVSLLSK